jgi:hypothetical protein
MKVTIINQSKKDNKINFKVKVSECDEYSWFDNGFYFGWVDKDLSNYYVVFIDEQENKRVVATKTTREALPYAFYCKRCIEALGLTDKEVDSYRVQGQRPCGRGYSCGCEYGEEIYQHGYDDSLIQELLELGSIL